MNTAVENLDRRAACAAIGAATERFTALLRTTADVGRLAAGTDWTVAETAAHVAVVLIGFNAAVAAQSIGLTPDEYVEGDFPTRLAACNAATLNFVEHTDAEALAQLINAEGRRFLKLVTAADPDQECDTPWYGAGRTRTVECLAALALGELTLHGRDIAAGTDRPWPISADDATLILGTVCPHMLPLVVRPNAGMAAPVIYEIRLRGGRQRHKQRFVLRVADGTAQVRAPGEPADCILSVDPVTFLLVSYGRMPFRRALLRGGIVLKGRRPWLGLRYKDAFFNP
ncbi:maleylpyruvate isomerase N-terminal domain-containing protein [Mycobacterium sp. 29Ha]|uniref:maleylpyruvate isomerase N-terminal domain-containing protein n=1 Tax=Mycobacterium sp. 29Ha TaxID=2939268 RepID=UPI002938F47E|nr:maleylpyruvate isomerase N-terminal domain-containing protein [Mycobacterium sp. 29Ha]MDV3130689.1 maleylpyruvate isomerase N-terminal domain-containing protein [Mycobacterium sp. 29Ha]